MDKTKNQMDGLKILYLEESEFDVEIVKYIFKREHIDINLKQVSNKKDYIRQLKDFRPDLVLANFSQPSIECIEALHIVRKTDPDMPFIFLSGIMGEENAIEVIKSGATDYVLKHRLSRLIPAIRRALLEAREKAKRIHAEKLKQRYDFIVNASRSMFTLIDRKYIYEAVNDAFCRAHKKARREIIGKSIAQIWGKNVFEKFIKKNFEKSFSDNVVRYQAWFEVPESGLRCYEVTIYPYKEYEQDVTHAVVDTMDITDRQKAEAQQALLYAAIEQSAEIVCITNAKGIIEYVNSSYLVATGYESRDLLGKSYEIMLSKEYSDKFFNEIIKIINRENLWRGNMNILKKNGKSLEAYTSISPVRNAMGEIINFVAVQRDITDEIRLQNYLQRAQRMETIGTLAGGIAHDFNNILATIIGYTDIAMQDLPKDHSSFHDLEQILKASNRAKDLVNKILTFSRQMESKTESVSLVSYIQDTVRMLEGSIPKKIKIKTSLDSECPQVIADPSHLHQIIMNICTNAFYSMQKKGGYLYIKLKCQIVDDKFLSKYPNLRKGKYARMDFRDTGTGIKHDIIERIFEPFFTTKPVSEGTGLGLSVVHGLVKNMNGEILVESKSGKGSTFSVLLPAGKTRRVKKKSK
jgi:PAS domain S-box-containing protein